MQSKIANEARRALVAATQKMTPAERLEACLVHSRLLAELHEAGQRLVPPGRNPRP
jgi:hypothetical protein